MAARGMVCCALALLMASGARSEEPGDAKDARKYVGAEKCKNCHSAPAKGDQYTAWTKMKHAKAFEVLATDAAIQVGKKKGIQEPQKSADCLRCHVTAFEAPATQKHKKFDMTLGIQCETCHGPGSKHVEARLAAEDPPAGKPVEIPKDEIIAAPSANTCLQCHNEKSPSYKPFCFKKAAKETAHLDPRKTRPADFFDKLPCDCEECKKASASPPPEKK